MLSVNSLHYIKYYLDPSQSSSLEFLQNFYMNLYQNKNPDVMLLHTLIRYLSIRNHLLKQKIEM